MATVTIYGDVEIEVSGAGGQKVGPELDTIQLSIFSHRFMSTAEQMGRVLQRTSISTNIKVCRSHDLNVLVVSSHDFRSDLTSRVLCLVRMEVWSLTPLTSQCTWGPCKKPYSGSYAISKETFMREMCYLATTLQQGAVTSLTSPSSVQ